MFFNRVNGKSRIDVIADPAALETTITVSAVGTYVLKLEAFDGEYTGEDEMVITVHPDDWPK